MGPPADGPMSGVPSPTPGRSGLATAGPSSQHPHRCVRVGVRQAVAPVNFGCSEPLSGIAFLPRPSHPHEAERNTSKAPQGAFLLPAKYPERSCSSECWSGRGIEGLDRRRGSRGSARQLALIEVAQPSQPIPPALIVRGTMKHVIGLHKII
jgi:hypothetical protein